MQKIERPDKPNWFNEEIYKKNKKKLLNSLLEITKNHCFYTDKLINNDIAEIEHFRPIIIAPELEYNWNNLFIAEPYTNTIKGAKFDEKLLNPCDNDYDFEKYFVIDFKTTQIFPSTVASKVDSDRAKVTIELLGLNNPNLVLDRKNVLERYLFMFNLLKEKAEKEGEVFNPDNYKELDIDNYSYRFLIKKALGLVKKESNEYIKEIQINKYFGIEKFVVSHLDEKKEIYFLGENGDGKTLVLQAIITALRGLNEKFIYKYVSENTSGNFDIRVVDVFGNEYLFDSLLTYINKNVFAYGASRLKYSNQINNDNNGYLTLFDFNTSLINPVLWLKEIERKELKGIGGIKLNNAINLLENLLENRVTVLRTNDGEFIFDERGTKVTFNQLSDGYRSTIIWLCDLLSRLSANQPNVTDLRQYKGIVLIDEIGVFLHPRWEFSIVKNLRSKLPNIQWIFTTHSPTIILGASNDATIFKLYKEAGITKVSQPFTEPLNMTANSLLTSMLWRLETFTTKGITPENISADDYVYQKIHQVISKYVQDVPELSDESVIQLIEKEFEKIKKSESNNKR